MTDETNNLEPAGKYHGMGAVLIFVGIAVMVSLVWAQFQQAKRRGSSTLETHGTISPFVFTNARTGEESSLPAKDDNFRVIGVLSTREGGVAPMLTGRMRELAGHLDRMGEDRVRLVTITNDPHHDTVNVLAAYAKANSADAMRWEFLTGRANSLAQWIEAELFGPLLGEGEAFPSAPTRLILLDPEGNIRAFRDAQNPGVVGNLLHDIGALDREFPANPPAGG